MNHNIALEKELAEAIEQFFKFQSNGADAYAGSVNFQNALIEQHVGIGEKLEMAVNLGKILESFLALCKNIPVLGNALNGTSLALNIGKLNDALNASGTGDLVSARAALSGIAADLTAITSSIAFLSVAVVSAPVAITVAGFLATFSIGFSVYSTTAGIDIKQKQEALLKWSLDRLGELGAYGDFKWSEANAELFDANSKGPGSIFPLLQMQPFPAHCPAYKENPSA